MLTLEGSGGSYESAISGSSTPLPRLHHQGQASEITWSTDEDTRFAIALSNGVVLAQGTNTRLTFDHFSQLPFDTETASAAPRLEPSRSELHLHLEAGTIALRTGELRANSDIRITINDVALHIGGGFIWIQNDPSRTEIRIFSGSARLERGNRETIFLSAGDSITVADGEFARESIDNTTLHLNDQALMRAAERGFRRILIHPPTKASESPLPVIRVITPPRPASS